MATEISFQFYLTNNDISKVIKCYMEVSHIYCTLNPHRTASNTAVPVSSSNEATSTSEYACATYASRDVEGCAAGGTDIQLVWPGTYCSPHVCEMMSVSIRRYCSVLFEVLVGRMWDVGRGRGKGKGRTSCWEEFLGFAQDYADDWHRVRNGKIFIEEEETYSISFSSPQCARTSSMLSSRIAARRNLASSRPAKYHPVWI